MKPRTNFTIRLAISVAVLFLFQTSSPVAADNYVILDGLGGMGAHWMQGEANRLRCQGHQVTYRPWWRWRSAVRVAGNQGPVHMIGYSLGGSRAVRASRQLDVVGMELIDPYLHHQVIVVPPVLNATVYRAGYPSRIQSSPVVGQQRELILPEKHIGVHKIFRQY